MDISKLLQHIINDATESENELGGVAASAAIKTLASAWMSQDVTVPDIKSDLTTTICDLVNLSVRIDLAEKNGNDELLDYELSIDRAIDIVEKIM
jgi:hypothetical protein